MKKIYHKIPANKMSPVEDVDKGREKGVYVLFLQLLVSPKVFQNRVQRKKGCVMTTVINNETCSCSFKIFFIISKK